LAEWTAIEHNVVATKETRLQFLIAIVGLVLFGNHAAVESNLLDGSYVVRTLNGRLLPAEVRVPAQTGDFRLFRLEQGVLTLRANGRFTLYFRYYHQLVRRGERPVTTPVLSHSETGTYRIKGDTILFTARKKGGAPSHAPIPASILGEEIKASYTLSDAGLNQRVFLVLRRDASYW
jgi:hypothetical protein